MRSWPSCGTNAHATCTSADSGWVTCAAGRTTGVGDFFPTGDHVTDGPAGGQYGDATYYPLPSSEYEGNPNIRRGG
jgi:hypothetical protein